VIAASIIAAVRLARDDICRPQARLPEPPTFYIGLRPFSSEKIKFWKAGNDVGNVHNNRPELINPITDMMM
jgi:hypothetical protein